MWVNGSVLLRANFSIKKGGHYKDRDGKQDKKENIEQIVQPSVLIDRHHHPKNLTEGKGGDQGQHSERERKFESFAHLVDHFFVAIISQCSKI